MILRPDVYELLMTLIQATPLPASWSDYEYAKLKLSQSCGFDSENCDQKMYERALREYCQRVGL
jgi:hypothetical protein